MIAATVAAMPVEAIHGRISIEGANVYLDGNAGVISMLEVPTHGTGISKNFLHFHHHRWRQYQITYNPL